MQTLFINGSVGSGKTTTAEEIGRLLRDRNISHAVVDLDWLRVAWPAPTDDPFNTELELRNLAAVAQNFRSARADRLVLAGVMESQSLRSRYELAVGGHVTVCRVAVDIQSLQERLALRHRAGSDNDWYQRRAGELDAILVAAHVDDAVVEVGSDKPEVVAERVLRAIGWY